MTTFVDMYHPALGNVHVLADSSAVSLYEAHGWVLTVGTGPTPDPIDLTPALGDLRYAKLGDIPTPGTATGDALRAASESQFSGRVVASSDAGYDIIIAAGQSNMQGVGLSVDTARIDVSDPRVFQFAQSSSYSGVISLAVEPLGYPLTASGKGPAMEFARWYVDGIPSNRRVLIVPVAYGGTGFNTSSLASPPAGYQGGWAGTWEVGNTNGVNLFDNAVTAAKAALAAAGANARVAAILWHQGEADGTLLTQTQYAAKLDALIDGFRAQVPTASAAPFILGQLMPEYIDAGGAGVAGINAAHIDTPYRKLGSAFVYSPRGYQQDSAHFTAAGQRLLGRGYYDALATAKVNQLGATPLAPGAITFTQSGTSLIPAWVRPVCRVTDYLVQYKTTGSSTWTTLTRARSIDNTATVTGLTFGSSYDVRVSTVNEQGTSVPSAAATYVMANPPAQVTGLAAGTPTPSAVPLTWTAASGATGYTVEYRTTGSTPWTLSQNVTGTSATVTGLAPSTGYDLRVSATNTAGTGTPSATVTATTANPSTLATDVGVTPSAAYSLRKVVVGALKAVQARRSSDSAVLDIGFVGNELDTSSLLTWAGTDSVYVAKWYDQSGSAHDAVQATATLQPRIVTAGALETVNGKPCAVFDGVGDVLTLASFGIYAAGATSHLAVTKASAPASGLSSLWAEGGSGRYMPLYAGSAGTGSSIVQDSSGTTMVNLTGGAWANGLAHQHSMVDTGAAMATWMDAAVAAASTTYTRAGHTLTPTNFALGSSYLSGAPLNYYLGRLCEVVIFASALATAARQAGEQNQKAYWTTP